MSIIGFIYILIFIISIETVVLFTLISRTPAMKFLKASLKKEMMLIHPRESGHIEFVSSKLSGALAHVKKLGYYIINPKYRFIETKSKVPCVVVYGKRANNIDITSTKISEKWNELGLEFLEDVIEARDKGKLEDKITILGESVDPSIAINYFSNNERSDIIEADINQRVAAVSAGKGTENKDIVKTILVIAIVIGIVFVLYSIFGSSGGASAVSGIIPTLPQPSGNGGVSIQ